MFIPMQRQDNTGEMVTFVNSYSIQSIKLMPEKNHWVVRILLQTEAEIETYNTYPEAVTRMAEIARITHLRHEGVNPCSAE